ncbi:MAG: ECF-type sigma factor [Gemmataceae bacterium]|nr:ECF-type sigma factor [Gemmataceae bacterium]
MTVAMESPESTPSVTRWIAALKQGDDRAAAALWQRYFDRLVAMARKKLGATPRRAADEEDVALSVFRCLCDGAAHGRFPVLTDRDDLWRLLTTLTLHKAIDQKRRAGGQKRGGGRVRGESVFAAGAAGAAGGDDAAGLDNVLADEPTPEVLATLAEEHARLLGLLDDDTLRQVALGKMEGYTNEELAAKLGLTCRSIERKLNRIRTLWLRESLPRESPP